MASEGDPPVEHSHSSKGEGSAGFLRAARSGHLDKVLELLRAGTDINSSNANGLNALHLASKEGHSDVVRELLKRKANVDAATRKGNTALHIASLAGQNIIVTILVENGANVNVQSLNGFTPLYMAAQENHEEVVRFLLSHGANQALSTEDGFTPLAVALQQGHDRVVALLLENDTKGKVRLPALHIAAKKDDTKAATLLLQNDHNADVTSKSGFTPLHIAAHYGNENVAQLLIEKGANVNYTARHNISPLHVATKWGRTNMVQLLLQNGAIIDSRTRDLLTPLHCAARSGHDQVVDMLLEKGAPISAKTKNGLAPLHMAAQGDHVDSARILLYHRAPVDDVTVDYLTPLHVAAHCGHVRVAKLLLDRNADPNARALNGFTPLHIACKKNRIKVVELLLKYHASIEATTESGLSPLHVASFMGAINIVIYLLQQGANPDVATVRGETPLHLAARANQTDVVRVLIRNGAKVDAQARELQTPLHIASRLGNTDIVILLLQAGANPNSATRDQYSPLHIAAKEGQDEVAGILLDHGADKTLLTKKGFTPLHLASKYGNLEVVKLLLEKGCPVDIEGKNQVTPLHVAAHYNNDKVAMLLLEHGASAKAAAKNGYTPLHIAAKKNQMDIAGTLLQYHADPNAKSRAGFTPLHLSSQEGHKEMAALLIENGSDVGAKANNGLTSMHLCAQEDHVPVAEELYKHRADINPQTNAGYTPLHVACHFGQLNMVRFLVEHGANVGERTRANFTSLHQAAQQGHNNVVRYLLDHGASPNEKNAQGQTPLAIAQRLGYVSVVETLKTVTETTVITETTTVQEDKYKPQNPEAMNETMFSESEDEGAAAEHEAAAAHVKDFSDNLTQGLMADSTGMHLIHTGEQLLNKSSELEAAKFAPDAYQDNLDDLIRKAQVQPVHTAPIMNDSLMDKSIQNDNIPIGHNVAQPSKLLHKTFLISFLVDARGGAMRGCRHSGVRIIVPPRKASQPIRVTCRYLRKDKLAHPPPLSEGEELASRILEMAPAGAKFLGPVILEVPHFASLRDREREIVILRSDDGQHWKEHQLEATEDAVQEVLNESFDAEELAALDDLQTPRITRILTNDFPMYFAVVTRVRQEVHCVGPEGGVIVSSVVPRVQAIFPDGSLTKTIKVSVQAQPVPQEMVTRLHGNRVAVSPIVTVEPRRRKFHKPITLCIPLPQSGNKAMLTQYSGQPGQEPPTLRLLCSITGGSAPAQWEDITGTTQLTFTGEEVSFTTTVSARFWLMDCQTPRDAARMAQEVYNEAISIPYMAKFAVFARRTFPVEGQLRVFCMTDDKEDKTLEKQEHFKLIAKSRDVEVLKGKHQFLEFAGNLVPVTKSGDQLSLYFQPFQENRLAFMVKTRNKDDSEADTEGRIAFMREPKNRSETLAPQAPICTLAITLPEYTGEIPAPIVVKRDTTPFDKKYQGVMDKDLPEFIHQNVLKGVGPDWQRLARALEVPHRDIQQVRQKYPGKELPHALKIWIHLKKEEATPDNLDTALRRIGRDDIVRSVLHGEPETLSYGSESPASKRFDKYEPTTLEPSKKYVDLPPVRGVSAPAVETRHVVQHEESHVEEPEQVSSTAYRVAEPLHMAEKSQPQWSEEAEPVTQTIPEEDEEAPVSEVRTVVRTERHVHDTDEGPMVEERTITTTYEDDVAINEHVVDKTVPLTEEELEKWNELHRLAEESPSRKLHDKHELPEGVEQEVETEQHVEDDGTIVTTTTMTSHYTETRSESPVEKTYEEDALQGIVEAQGISSETIHHVGSKSRFEAETWSGEHEEHQHQEDRRYSLVHDNETTKGHDEDTPIASSEHFERKRTPSLAAALLEVDPQGVPLIHFFHPANDTPLLEAEEDAAVEVEEAGESEKIISSLLFLLREMKMKEPEKYTIAVQRLRELEAELRAAGAVTPADPAVSDAVARALAASGPGRDVQIRVNQSRHTTTTKTVYETETPGMAGLDPEKIRELHQQMLASITSGQTDSSADSGTTQKKETAEEGFTNEDGSVVVSKKMTRVVTTTKTTLPGEGEAPAPDSPTESLGSVKDRIAKFESLKEGDQASIASSASEEREPTTARSERSYLEHAQVDIVVTPGSPVPPGLDEEDEVAEAQEPLSPSVEEVSQAEVKSVGSYEEEQEEQEPLSPESDRSSTADILSNEPDSARRQKKREILEQSTTTTYDFSTSKEDRRRLQQGAEGEHPEEYLGEHEKEYHKETALESPTEEMPHHRAEAAEAPDTHKSHERRETTEHTTTTTYDFTTTKEDRKHLERGDEGELSEEHLGAHEQEQLKEKAMESPVEETPYHRTEVTETEYGREEPESPSAADKLKDFAKGAGKVAAGVVAAPIALAAVGAAAAYDKLKGDKDEREEEAVKESPDEATRYEEPYTPTEEAASEVRPVEEIPRTPSPPAAPEVSSPTRSETERVPEEEEPAATTTVTKEYEFAPEHEEAEHVQEEEKPQHFTETTTIVTESFYDEPSPSDRGSLGGEEEEHKPHHVVETTTITKEYDVGSEESPVKEEFLREAPFEPEAKTEEHALRHVVETTTIRREYDEEEPATVEQETVAAPIDDAHISQHVTEEAKKELESPEGGRHIVETTTITTEQTYYDEPETKDELLSPESEQELPHVARDEETPEPTSPEDHHVHKVIEKTTTTKEVFETPEVSEERITSTSGQEPERSPEEEKHIVEQTTVITETRYFEEPQKHSPVEEQPPVPQKRASIAEHHEEEILKESPKEEEPYEPIGEESDEERGVGDKLKGLAKGVGKVIAAPVALAAVGAAAAYEKLRRGSEEEEALAEEVAEKSPVGEEVPTPAKRTTAEEPIATSSPIEPETKDTFEEEHEEPIVVETTTVTREYYEEPESFELSTVAGEEDHEKPHHVVEVTAITKDYYEEATQEELPISEEQKQPGEQEEPGRHIVETTTITREYDVGSEDHATEEPESFEGLIDDFHMPSHLIEAAKGELVSQEEQLAEKPSHIVETTTTVRESFEVPESPAGSVKEEEPEHHERHVIETTTITKDTYYDEPTEEERLFEEPTREAEEHHERPSIVETTTITREYDEELGGKEIGFEQPEDLEIPGERKEKTHHLEEEGVGTPALPSELPSPPPSPAEKVETEEAEEEHVKRESYYFEPETAEKREEEPALHEPVSYSEAEEHLQEPVETPKLDEETKEDVHYREEYLEPEEEHPTTRESHPDQDHQHLEGVHREGAIRRHSHDEDQSEEPKERLDEYQHVYHEEEHLPHEVGARPMESVDEHYPGEEEEEGESTKDKLLGFAKGVGKVAAGVVAAPVALAAVGAAAAYDKLKGDKDEEEDKMREEYLIKESPIREEHHFEEPTEKERQVTESRDFEEHHDTTSPVKEEQHFEAELHREEEPGQYLVKESPREGERLQESGYVHETGKSEQGLPETTTPVHEEFRIEVEEPRELSHDVEPAELSDKLKEEQEEQEHREEQRPEHPSSLHVQEVPQAPSDLASPSDEENRLPIPIAPTDLPSNVETPDSEKAPAEEEESQHIVETTIVTKETFDEPETTSLDEPHMHHVVETTTIRRDVYYDEPTEEGEIEPHIVETTTTTHEASYDEPTSPKRSGEESPAEGEHTIETTITTRQVMPEEPLSPEEHHHEPHVLETSTTVKDTFYDEEESTTAEPYLEDIEEKEEEHLEEGEHPRFVETTTTTRDITFHETPAETEEEGEIPHHDNNREVEIYTKTEYHDEPTGLEDMGEALEEHHRRTETTTTVKEIFYDKHSSRESPVPSDEEFDVEKALKHKPVEESHEEPIHVTETTTTVRDYYDEPSPVEESPSRDEEVPHHLHETITTERDFFEEPEKSEHAAPEHREPLHVVETTVTTKDSYPEEASPVLEEKYCHEEEPLHKPGKRTEEHHYPPQEEEGDEGESTKDKLFGFAKGVGKVAAGVVAAPIALAAVGAVAAYDKLKGDDEDEDKTREEYLVKESPIREEHHFEEPTERGHHATKTTSPVTEERRLEDAELHRKEEPEYVIESREAQFEERQELASPTRSPSPPGKESQQHSDFLVEEEHHFEEEPKIAYGLESPSASEKEPEHVIESRETLFEERPELASPTASEREELEETPHHIIETKITTTETYYDEEDQPHVKETTTTRRDLVEEIDRSGQESPVDRVVESTTVTTERVLEPKELLAEEHTHEPELTHERHIIESTEDIRQPLEEPSSPVVAKREQWEETEERTPFEEKEESGDKDEEDLHRVVETFTTQREYYPEEALGDEQELHGTRIVETVSTTKESFYDEPSPTEETKEEQGGEDEEGHLHHVREATTVTTETFYEEPEEGEQEKGADETGSNASVIEQEVDRPSHAVETTTTVKETYFDEPSPVESEKESVQEHAESQEQLEPHHIVETTTVTKETYYDEPAAEEPHHIVESTTTVRKTTFEEADSPHASQEALFHGETPGHEETVPVVTEETITKREVFYDEPEVEELPPAEHVIESEPYATEAQYEEPTSPVVKEKQFEEAEDYQQGLESADESDDEATSPTKKKKGLGSKIMGFAKKAGVAVVAPVALAAKGASTAYDALKHKDKEPKEIQGEEVMHDKEERVYTFKGQESESEESPLGSPETARKTEEAREEEMEHVIPSEEYEIPTQTHVPLDVMESRIVEEEQHVIESETYEDLSQVPAATIKVDTVADEEEEEDIPAEEKESHVIESTDFHPSHYEEQIRIDSRAEQPEEEEDHVIESTSYEEDKTAEAVHEPEEYRTSPLIRRDELEKDEDEQLRTTEYYEEEEKEAQDRASTPASSDSRIIHDVVEETHSDRPLDEETGEPVTTTEEEHIHYERPEHLTERESHPEQDHRHLEGVHREGAIRRHSHDEGQPQKLEEGTEDDFHHTEEHLHQETSPRHLETSYEEEIHEQRAEDVGKAPIHEEDEYLTAPVVSGYTASGEPINTGIVISAPPSPAKQMPTHEAYNEEEKEHETVGYVEEEQAHRAEEHLSHEPAPRHYETGYEEERYPAEEEEEGESTKDKLVGFAKGVGKVAAGVVAAPIALAAVGAVAAYDKLKGDDEDEDKTREEYLVKESPIREEHHTEAPTERGHHVTESREFEEHHDTTSPVKEEQHFEAELHREEEPEHVIESRETQFEERHELASPARSPSPAAKDTEKHPEEEEYHFEEADIHREEGLKHVIDSGETHFEDRLELESPGRSPSPAQREFKEHREQSPKDLEETREEHPEIGSPEKDEQYLVEEPKESFHGSPVSEKEPEHVIESTEATFDDRAEISSPTGSEKLTQEEHLEEKPHHIVETTVTTTETCYDEEDQPHVSETTTTTRELVEDEPVSEVRSEEESPVDRVIETTTITTERIYEPEELITEEQDHPHLHEITTTTTTREIYGSPEEEEKAPLGKESILGEEERLHEETTERPHVIETTTTTTETHYEPEEQRTDLEGESPASEKPFEESPEHATHGKEPIYGTEEDLNEPRQVVETTTITRESHFYEEPAELSPVAEEGKEFYSEQETKYAPQHLTETTTMTTATTYHEEPLETPSSEQESGYEHGKTGEDLGEREEPLHDEGEVHREPISKEESHQVMEPSPTLPSEGDFVEERKDISGEPIHVEDEYLTAPVVSGYTASGEPINTGIVISAPPSPAKQMPTEEGYLDEEKEHETPVQHHAEYDEPEQKEEQPHSTEEHLYHETTPRHFETGYEEERYTAEEEEGESTKDKLLGFAKGVGKVAAGVVAAPIALAAVGAVAAYDKLKGDDEDEDKTREEYLVKESPIRGEHHIEEPTERGHNVTESREFEEHHYTTSPVKEEQHFEKAELHREEEPEHVIESRETQFEERHELASPARSPSPAAKEAEGQHEDTLVRPSSPATTDVHYEESPSEDRGFTQAERRPSHDQREYKPEEETLEERLSPESKMEISHFVTDVVEEATAGAVIEAAEDLTPRSQRGDHLHELEELALENVNRMRFEEEPDHLQSPEKQSEESPSSDRDESRLIAGDDEWKVYDSTGQVVEEFSAQLTDQAIEDAGADVIQAISPVTASPASARRLIAQESMNEVAMEPEVDYQSDLQEKLDILAGQKSEMLPMVREEELDVIHESEGESEEPDPINETAARLVDEVIETVLEEHDGGKTSSDYFYTATEKSKDDQYDTCVTSQEDTFETAQGWTSQDSEYTTATSEAPSRLSELEERTEGTTTPQAALSPVDSDRQFVVDLDKEPRPVLSSIRSFTLDDETARSTPDVALQITIEEEDEPDEGMVTSPSGVLLAPHMDPGRPVSPVPPRKQQTPDDEEGAFVFVARDHSKELGTEESVDVPETPSTSEVSDESARYTRHSSDVSEVSHADTVIHKEQERDDQSVIDEQLPSTFVSHGGSADSLDKASVKSTGRRSSGSSIKAPEEPAEPEEKESPKSQDLSPDQTNLSPHLESPHIEHQELETEEGFVMYQREGDEQGELETVEEEPEDADSLNGGSGNSSVGAPASLAKYKHVSSDNVSLTSLQEFERLEQLVASKGDSSLTASEIELYTAGRPRSMEGSMSSLAEFERLEQEMTHQANQSPQDEMMLSVVKEESEAEDMSIRDDDEDEAFSETEIKSRPVNEEEMRAGTPQALSPSDSLERDVISNIAILETSTDSLEPSFQQKPQSDIMADSLTEYEVVPRMDSTRDSLENIPMDKDSLLEVSSQDQTSQETHGLLSGDTVGTYQEHDDDDKDSLGGEMESMLRSYPTTLTTFETTTVAPDGSIQTISRRVETRVVDPVMSHVEFTGTESQERLNQLPLEQPIDTVDAQGNVTRTLFKRQPPHSE